MDHDVQSSPGTPSNYRVCRFTTQTGRACRDETWDADADEGETNAANVRERLERYNFNISRLGTSVRNVRLRCDNTEDDLKRSLRLRVTVSNICAALGNVFRRRNRTALRAIFVVTIRHSREQKWKSDRGAETLWRRTLGAGNAQFYESVERRRAEEERRRWSRRTSSSFSRCSWFKTFARELAEFSLCTPKRGQYAIRIIVASNAQNPRYSTSCACNYKKKKKKNKGQVQGAGCVKRAARESAIPMQRSGGGGSPRTGKEKRHCFRFTRHNIPIF